MGSRTPDLRITSRPAGQRIVCCCRNLKAGFTRSNASGARHDSGSWTASWTDCTTSLPRRLLSSATTSCDTLGPARAHGGNWPAVVLVACAERVMAAQAPCRLGAYRSSPNASATRSRLCSRTTSSPSASRGWMQVRATSGCAAGRGQQKMARMRRPERSTSTRRAPDRPPGALALLTYTFPLPRR